LLAAVPLSADGTSSGMVMTVSAMLDNGEQVL
jgi:hypothetical protein